MATGMATGPRPGMTPKSPPPPPPPALLPIASARRGDVLAACRAAASISRGSIDFKSRFDIRLLGVSRLRRGWYARPSGASIDAQAPPPTVFAPRTAEAGPIRCAAVTPDLARLFDQGILVRPAHDQPNLVHLVRALASLTGVRDVDTAAAPTRG